MSSFNNSFRLNGVSFDNEEALLEYSKGFSTPVFNFLIDWFRKKDYVEVKTSGSTGKPKLIRLQKEFMVNSAQATGAFFNLKENTTALVCLSSEYIAGKMMLVRALVLGWHIDIISVDSTPLLKTKKNYDFAAMVPMQLQNSLIEIHRVKKLIVGGGIVSSSLAQEIQKVKTKIFATYGMTETITHIAIKQLNHFSEGFIGSQSFYKTLPNVQIYKDQRSCLVIGAPMLSKELVITNDVIELISNKEFKWVGRFDNVINSGGVKLQPERIEEKLAKVISSRFFVAGVKDEVLGEKLVLIVEGKERDLPLGNLDLTTYEIPKNILFVDAFLLTDTNKVNRTKTLDFLMKS